MFVVPFLLFLAGCAPDDAPAACDGLDVDGDGVCDRENADWSASADVGEGRPNIYGLPEDDLDEVVSAGLQHAFVWPVDISGVYLPYRSLSQILSDDPELGAVQAMARQILGFGNLDELYAYMGLPRFEDPASAGRFAVQLPPGAQPGDPMGMGVVSTDWGDGLTFSCATCHAASFLGHTVVGMTNRVPRANKLFDIAKDFFPTIDEDLFQRLTDATPEEMEMFRRTSEALPAIGTKEPAVLGLDTSLAQVARSLARREDDAWATRSADVEANPRPNDLDTFIADSKPAVWWTMKYKTRWLSDGSVVGNPIFTNFLWNEIGRATDLHDLHGFLSSNMQVVDELTVAVFATQAPRWTDFFPADTLDADAARRGQATFNERCASCHGTYDKAWDQDQRGADAFRTVAVHYPETVAVDVGTDPQRADGMQAFTDALNGLELSAWMKTEVTVQRGYVPPPLDGIWARFPYMHNNAIPSLCALLSPESERPAEFWMGPTTEASSFDTECVGYPTGDATPAAWMEDASAWYDTSREGMSNGGHTSMLTGPGGEWLLTPEQRSDLIMFLRTL